MIAALFVETGGCYFGLPGVDPWDEARDARQYAGPHSVIAHPPCARWGRFATWHGRKLGDDNECFWAAFKAVMTFGGVLEHPAHSKAWQHYGIARPRGAGWQQTLLTGWVCEVEQAHYGHPARKATWLIYHGTTLPPELIWGPAEQRLPARRLAERGYESARRCGVVANMSSGQRQRTPPEFRDVLLSIARGANASPAAQSIRQDAGSVTDETDTTARTPVVTDEPEG